MAKLKEEGLEVQLGLVDIEDETSIKQFAAVVAEKYSPVSILINNAGFAFKVSFPNLTVSPPAHQSLRMLPQRLRLSRHARPSISTTTAL